MPTSDANRAIMTSAKQLRRFLKVQESSVCETCPLAASCSWRSKELELQKQADLGDVFNVLSGLYMHSVRTTEQTESIVTVSLSQAAGTTASMLAQTFEDFEENNGLEFKMFFNEVKKEAEAMR